MYDHEPQAGYYERYPANTVDSLPYIPPHEIEPHRVPEKDRQKEKGKEEKDSLLWDR